MTITITDSLITIYDQNIRYLNAVRKVLTEDISYEESKFSEKELENQNKKKISKLKRPIVEDSLLRAFVYQQDKYINHDEKQYLDLISKEALHP